MGDAIGKLDDVHLLVGVYIQSIQHSSEALFGQMRDGWMV